MIAQAESDRPDAHGDVHDGLHSEQGAIRGDRPHRATNPVIKVEDVAWLEFEKPDLDAAERFAHDFGFVTAARTANTLHLRGALAGTQCVVIRRGRGSRFVGPTFRAADRGLVQPAPPPHQHRRPVPGGVRAPSQNRRYRGMITQPT